MPFGAGCACAFPGPAARARAREALNRAVLSPGWVRQHAAGATGPWSLRTTLGRGWAGCTSEAEQPRSPPVASHEYVLSSLTLARLQPSASGGCIGCQRDPNDRYLKGFSPLLRPKKLSRARMSLAERSSIGVIYLSRVAPRVQRSTWRIPGAFPGQSRAQIDAPTVVKRLIDIPRSWLAPPFASAARSGLADAVGG